ncbi:MAG: energy transducer TonB [Campylobacterota bacterium]|nr:energy transducer TonB [Campylobacterota bacterium]
MKKKRKAVLQNTDLIKKVKTISLPKEISKVKTLKTLFTLSKTDQVNKVLEQDNHLNEYKESEELEKLDEITKSYIKLYELQYQDLSLFQKNYIKKNISTIGKITQQYLKYPSISIRTNQQGTNIVEFTLHPNGDISNLTISDSSKYSSLDKNTIKTIKIAYKDYPRPKEPTPVKIYVNYILY